MSQDSKPQSVKIEWRDGQSERLWMGAWIVSQDGAEGDIFYDGPGSATSELEVPDGALGVRLRCWEASERAGGGLGRAAFTIKPIFFTDDVTSGILQIDTEELVPAN
jgi:hypothetical protein